MTILMMMVSKSFLIFLKTGDFALTNIACVNNCSHCFRMCKKSNGTRRKRLEEGKAISVSHTAYDKNANVLLVGDCVGLFEYRYSGDRALRSTTMVNGLFM